VPSELWGVVTDPLENLERQTISITPDIRLRMVGLLDALTDSESWFGSDDDIEQTVQIAYKLIAALYGAGFMEFCIAKQVYGAGVGGGTSFDTTWNTRNLNVISGVGNWYSLAIPEITLLPGKYIFHATASGYGTNRHRLRVHQVNTAQYVYGQSLFLRESSGAVQGGTATIWGILDIAMTEPVRLEHYTTFGFATEGLGRASNSGTEEIYAEMIIVKVE